MKTLKVIFFLITVLAVIDIANSQPPEFDYPKVDFYWISMQYGDTVPGMNGNWSPTVDPGEDTSWLAYVDDITQVPFYNTWFYNGPLNLNNMKKVRMGFWVRRINAEMPANISWVVNWSSDEWIPGQGYPRPEDEEYVLRSAIHFAAVGLIQPPNPGTWVETYYEIPYYNPEWISVDVWGENVAILPQPFPPPESSPLHFWWMQVLQNTGQPPKGGIIVHECVPKPPDLMLDFGDAPEGDTAYLEHLNNPTFGAFPTCMNVGPPLSYISHGCPSSLFFGGLVDCEIEGNAGLCPVFGPNWYNFDECGTIPYPMPPANLDEGLFKPSPFTIGMLPWWWGYFNCGLGQIQPLGPACGQAVWGPNIDIWLNGLNPNLASPGFFNLLADWNRDGDWNDVVNCGQNQLSEHVILNFQIPPQFTGPISLLAPPAFTIGPNGGHVWFRFTLTERPLPMEWDGSGVFFDGETEDYLLYVSGPSAVPVSNWSVILLVTLIAVFTLLYFVRKR